MSSWNLMQCAFLSCEKTLWRSTCDAQRTPTAVAADGVKIGNLEHVDSAYIYMYIYILPNSFLIVHIFFVPYVYIYIYTYYLAICLCHWKIPEMMQLFRWRISQSKKNHHYVNPDCPSERNASSPNLACSSWAANLWIYGVYGYQFELVNTNWGHSISMRWLPD